MKTNTAIAALLIFLLAPVSVFADQAKVITKENAVREYCKFFAPVRAPVRYNDTLDILSPQGDWFKVRYGAVEGCIHKTAVEKRAALQPSGPFSSRGSGAASEGEVALAGKGFNPQVEEAYKKKHPEMKYHLVDSVERIGVTDKETEEFITAGELRRP